MNLSIPKSIRKLIYPNKCPDLQDLAAYSDRQLLGAKRHAIESHLATCVACMEQIGFLVRTAAAEDAIIPAALIDTAFKLARRSGEDRRPAHSSWTVAWSGAVAALLISLTIWQFMRHERQLNQASGGVSANAEIPLVAEKLPAPVAGQDQTLLRGDTPNESVFLAPLPKATIDTANLVFRWKPVSQAKLYEIELVTDDGTVIWNQKVPSQSIALPRTVHLLKGATYFVRLRIYTLHGSEETKPLEFTVE